MDVEKDHAHFHWKLNLNIFEAHFKLPTDIPAGILMSFTSCRSNLDNCLWVNSAEFYTGE